MSENNEALAEQFADRFVGTQWRDDDGRIATIERVNSNHPDLDVGVFVDYEMSADSEWITPVEMQTRIENDEWEMWESEN
jgi:hypothetical protein